MERVLHPILIDTDITTALRTFIGGRHAIVVADKNLTKEAEALAVGEVISFAASEQTKTRETKQQLEDALFQRGLGRDGVLIAVGGGVVTDVVGFIAATYCRGIPCVYVPTSLLAMVDASIGGKTGVNVPAGKNLVGAFSQPAAVFMGLKYLKTLPSAEFVNGLVELIKHAVIYDADLFELLEQEVNAVLSVDMAMLKRLISRSCEIKQTVVIQDEREQGGIRQILNYGHTIAHGIEKLSGFSVRHGEAVARGMIVAAKLSVEKGYLVPEACERIEALLQAYQVPLPELPVLSALWEAMRLDKKSVASEPRFVLLDAIGQVHAGYVGAVSFTELQTVT